MLSISNFIDPAVNSHIVGARAYIRTAIRPGTRANHLTALRLFIGFSVYHALEYHVPTVSHVCAFIHYMTLHYANPRTILNYTSGLTSVLRRLRVDVGPFNSIDVSDFLASIKTNIRYAPNKRMPVQHEMLESIVLRALSDPEGPTVAFAYIIMFMTFLRQSNLAPRNKRAFDHTRHLTRRDVIVRHDAVIVAIKWSKTQQGPTATSVAAPAKPGSLICPREAYYRMLTHAPTRQAHQPLFSFADGTPLPTSYMNKAWDRIMKDIGCPHRAFTLHSLRRGAATEVYTAQAASIHQLQQHGQWASDAIYQYLPNDPSRSEVFQYFKRL